MNNEISELNLIFCPVSKGTLWRVSENTWKKELGNIYDQNSDRKEHKGLSILNSLPAHNNAKIPLLHGRSQKAPIKILETSPDGKPTHFGHLLKPVRMNISKLHQKITDDGPIGMDNIADSFGRSRKHWTENYEVIPNDYKKQITGNELANLDSFLASRKRK